MPTVVLFNKPYNVHSQFRKDRDQMMTLADYFDDKSLRVAGRLDKDSEGLLVLTDNGTLNHFITTPPTHGKAKSWGKTYLVQVEHTPTDDQLHALRTGVTLKDGKTLPAHILHLDDDNLPIDVWDRHPPIRERKNIPTAWLMITIFEGKNRQIRRMTAHVGLPCLRLIRLQIGSDKLGWHVGDLAVGQSRRIHISHDELTRILRG
ncbi:MULTISPECIES: pseudouridine synthase [Moraxella]|uniref:Pseudouridine synthase n=1 Tax=Moraxella lacunata TaxID=477 RepID=A0A1B8Q3Q5_MORLA|nr:MULTISPECIES: pseudouridine synthase [Moraxella]MBE9579035.1 pseudouridine synthase [Moraxella sp. K1664]MBE9588380.1 pseudouridine synthase [Moraxella sp. K1630]MBE9590964.1 pseudouridine synthase [Moraxella sp. K127]MBE9596437.1 pseudouridine synthase [Moraxella sp. K2450]MDH9218923.1 pseudouridine synthase [Moraxella lacunata]